MLSVSEDDVICDLAETYHITDYRALAPSLVATLCVGLPDFSRIKRRIAGIKIGLTDMLLALLVDGVNTLIWQNTKDGMKGRNRPESVYKRLTEEQKPKEEYEKFATVDDFETWYQSTMRE